MCIIINVGGNSMKEYRERIADKILKKVKGKGNGLIEEPKWCGKTIKEK